MVEMNDNNNETVYPSVDITALQKVTSAPRQEMPYAAPYVAPGGFESSLMVS